MKREIKLSNQKFAEAFHKHLTDNKVDAVLEKSDTDFVIKYELAANCCAPTKECDKTITHEDIECLMTNFYQALYRESDYLMRQIDKVYQWLYHHQEGHLPKIHGAEKMQNVLEKLGLDGDYQVQKSVIWAKDSRGNDIAVVEFIKSKE